MTPTETVEEYYEALRRGDSLSPYFAEGLRERTRTTADWRFGQMHVSAPRDR